MRGPYGQGFTPEERQELYRKRCFWLLQLLHELESRGHLSESLVERYAKRMQTTARTVRRWVTAGKVPSGERRGVSPADERLRELLIANVGNAAAAADVLKVERGRGYSRRNIQRVVNELMPADERAELRGGARARKNAQLSFRIEIEHPNEVWFVDHKESSVWVTHPVLGEPVKAWLSSVVDGRSRALVACIGTPGRPTKHDVKVLLFRAISQTDKWPVGGVPLSIVWDNDATFSSDDVSDILSELNLPADPIDAYAPTQNGRAEAFNHTLDLRFSRFQLSYAHGAAQRNGELYSGTNHALAWNVFLHKLDETTSWYRHEHEHSAIGGRHTEQEWLDLTADMGLPHYGPGALVWMLPERHEATVRKGGIFAFSNRYFSEDLILLPQRRVELAYSSWDTRTVEVLHNGRWQCTAKAAPPSEAERERFAGRVGARAADMSQRRKRVNQERRDVNDQLARELPPAAALSAPERQPAGQLLPADLEDEYYDLGGLAPASGGEEAS